LSLHREPEQLKKQVRLLRGAKPITPVRPDTSGFQRSAIFAHSYRLTQATEDAMRRAPFSDGLS